MIFSNKQYDKSRCQLKNVLALYLACFFWWLVPCPLMGQVKPLKQLLPKDYHLWGQLSLNELSPDGQWLTYKMNYESGKDTLYVRSVKGKKRYSFPQSTYGVYSASGYFATQTPQGLAVVKLDSGKKIFFPNTSSFAFSASGREIVLLEEMVTSRRLKIIRPNGDILKSIEGVTEFEMDHSSQQFAYAINQDGQYAAGIISLDRSFAHQWIVQNSDELFHGFRWHDSGMAIAFLGNTVQEKLDRSLLFYNIPAKKCYKLDIAAVDGYAALGYFINESQLEITIAADLQRVCFTVDKPSSNKSPSNQVQVWNGNDPYVYPQEQYSKDWYKARIGVWWPQTGRCELVTSEEQPMVLFAGNHGQAITSNPKCYEPQYEREGPKDYYIRNLETNEYDLLLKKHSAYELHLLPSAAGRYVAYFREGNWWIYDIATKAHRNLTAKLNVRFAVEPYDMGGEASACGVLGWTHNDKTILLYDNYDLWEIDPINGNCQRLTRGREKNIRFRVVENKLNAIVTNFNGFFSRTVPTENGLLLSAANDEGDTGYYYWKKDSGEHLLVMEPSRIDQLLLQNGIVVYREQRFDLSPRVIHKIGKDKAAVFVQSNTQQRHYHWATAKRISYQNSKGQALKGYLCYPADYVAGKKYPMIVEVYERQFRDFHNYIAPSLNESIGVNPSVFTSNGYFVLYPDIIFDKGNPGFSALDCTLSAIRKVIDFGFVDETKIGLVGHSFGGYETDFIITQTNVFAAAISGSAVTDLPAYYNTLDGKIGKPEYYRFENHQWRMDSSLFENRERYEQNSPMQHVSNVCTPLLSWTGNEDYHLDWHQSIAFYLALRRLNKKHILLLYPKEGHVLYNPVNRLDLMQRTLDWFGYYLKGDPAPEWIIKGTEG